jgi:TPR repeat protein
MKFRNPLWWGIFGVLSLSFLQGCADLQKLSEEKIAEALEEKGCDEVEVEVDEHDKRIYDFSAKCEDYTICKGTIEFDNRFYPSKWETASRCKLDEKACTKERSAVCAKIGDATFDPKDKSTAEKANGFWTTACEGGHGPSCRRLGLNVRTGSGATKDKVRATTLFESGCQHGDGPACMFAGYHFANAVGVKRDRKKAVTHYERGCQELNHGGSCNNLSYMYNNGLGVRKNRIRGAAFATKGCGYGDGLACAYIGLVRVRGSYGIKRDKEGGLALLRKGCDETKVPLACRNLGRVLRDGTAGPRDMPAAVAAIEKGCKLSDGPSCNTLGLFYRSGQGVARDQAKAVPLFEQACKASSSLGCLNAARAYRDGRGVPRDKAKAKVSFDRGCKLGVKTACREGARL